jgi:hypothetical protein
VIFAGKYLAQFLLDGGYQLLKGAVECHQVPYG